jgi:lysophospholipase L1-like esterase
MNMRSVVRWLVTFAAGGLAAVTPNPLLTRGLSPYASSTSGLSSLNDGNYGNGSWTSGNGSWVAYHLKTSPTKIVVAWNNPSYYWSDSVTQTPLTHSSCEGGSSLTFPANYQILTSSNSTNGTDGTWTNRLSVTGNLVSSRSDLVTTGGDSWVKLAISSGTGSLDEFDVYDASNGSEDTWAFLGTSISANTYKGTPPSTDFQKLVEAGSPANTPAVVKAGVPCITSTDVSSHISNYLKFAGSNHFWAIEMGTNDAWGGGSGNVTTFTNALQKIVDSAKAHGIKPMIARTLATNASAAGWQVNGAFLTAVDNLTSKNGLVAGPDLYTYFLAHPTELNSDGVHPNATGAASIQRLWAQAMLKSLYTTPSSLRQRPTHDRLAVTPRSNGWMVGCGGSSCADLELIRMDGKRLTLAGTEPGFLPAGRFAPGLYVLRSRENGERTILIDR